MFDRILSERNNQLLSNEEKNTPIDTNTAEFKELSFHFNTIFNDISQKSVSSDSKIYEIDRAYSLKNQYIALNFEKREQTEITSYGWFISETNDEKKFEELVYRLKSKGLEKLENEINVGPPISPNENDIHDIFLCKFIVGNSLIVFQNDELPDFSEDAYDIYDTIVKIENDKSKKYKIRKLENIQLLYLIKIKDSDFEPQLISCSNPNCKLNEPGAETPQQSQVQMYYCLLNESYLCYTCHKELHPPQIQLGVFDHSKCELKTVLNLPGECEGNHQKKENIDFFCQDCNKGICSYCSIYGNEKHEKLEVLSTLFMNSQPEMDKKEFFDIRSQFNEIYNKLTTKVGSIQTSNTNMADSLRKKLKDKFNILFNKENTKFEKEGEELIKICYQLNFIKDILLIYHKYYNDRENYLKANKLRQELLWTKKLHLEHILYLIGIKEKINTGYSFKEKEYDDIIDNDLKEIDDMIVRALGNIEKTVSEKDKEKDGLTIETIIKEAGIESASKALKNNN